MSIWSFPRSLTDSPMHVCVRPSQPCQVAIFKQVCHLHPKEIPALLLDNMPYPQNLSKQVMFKGAGQPLSILG